MILLEPIEIIVIIFAVGLVIFTTIFNIIKKKNKNNQSCKSSSSICGSCPIKNDCKSKKV